MKQKTVHFPVTLAGRWQSPNDNISLLSDVLKDWLLDEGSLTARLKGHCNHFTVTVIGEQQQLCSAAEACHFIKADEPVLVREVILYCDNVPQVFARSLLPLASLKGQADVLANLGEQPLGQVLFNNPSLQRLQLELATFSNASRVAILATELEVKHSDDESSKNAPIIAKKELWGRRSVFMLDNKPLMVAEVFLPNALAYQ